jgi:hypothetical protein
MAAAANSIPKALDSAHRILRFPGDNVTPKTNGDIAVSGDPDKMEDAVTKIHQKRESSNAQRALMRMSLFSIFITLPCII